MAYADGLVVAEGRSRRAETTAPANQLAGSRLAHAEVNALAQLTPDQHEGLSLYTTLEPCFLCSAALSIAHVRVVNYAGADPMWRFVDELPDQFPALEERWYTARGPLPGPLGQWATLLPIVERLQRRPGGQRIDGFNRTSPDLVRLATQLVEDGTADGLAQQSLLDGLDAVWASLVALDTTGARPR